jgi:adenosylhomocysteinase
MNAGKNYEIKDLSLWEQGKMNVEFAESHMGALMKIKQRFEK